MGKQVDIHEKLIERCQRKDERAQYEIYQLYSKAMFNVSLRILGNREDAEDVLQDSFMKAFNGIDRFRAESSFGAWLKRIVINSSLNHIRGRMHFAEVDNEVHGIEEEETEEERPYEVADVKQAMKELSDGYRTVFALYMFEDHSHKEIAQMLGISEGTSKSQLNRAKKRIQERLIEIGNERRQA